MTMINRLIPVIVLLAAVGCASEPEAPTVTHFPLSQLGQGPLHATGVSRDYVTGNLWLLVPGRGLVQATPDGAFVSLHRFDGVEFVDYGFTDVALLEDGSFALTANGEAYRYVPGEGVGSYFCLVPGWEDEEQIFMENQAVSLDPTTGKIYVAPHYYNGAGTTVESRFEIYRSADGAHVGDIDVMPTGVIAQGLAWDRDLGSLWAVEGGRIHRFDMTGAVLATASLTGISEAAGLTLAGDTFYVLDGADDEIRTFSRSELLLAL